MLYMRIAIMGCSSMGTLLSVCLAKAGKPIDLINVSREHVATLNTYSDGRRYSKFCTLVNALTPKRGKAGMN